MYRALREIHLAPVAQFGIGPLRADFAFPEVQLAVECDGRQYHDPDADRHRDSRLRQRGWSVLHFSGSAIYNDAASCAHKVAASVVELRQTRLSPSPIVGPQRAAGWWVRFLTWLRRFVLRTQPVALTASETEVEESRERPWLTTLDAEQRKAVQAHDGIVQVIAPAGSGKTTVLVARVAELLSRGVPPNRILCLTFNNPAAAEMTARLHQSGVDGVEALTFHALGRRVLKEAGRLRADVRTATYAQWRRLAKLAMDQTPGGVWIDAPEARDQVSELKLGRMLDADEFAAEAQTPEQRTLGVLYRLYQDQLVNDDVNDFDDYIFQGLRLLQRDPEVRRSWQQRYTAVLVDEHQDIEPAQGRLVEIVAAPEDMLFYVGDEDQCLYSWRRARVETIIELDETYPGLQRHALGRQLPLSITHSGCIAQLDRAQPAAIPEDYRPGAPRARADQPRGGGESGGSGRTRCSAGR